MKINLILTGPESLIVDDIDGNGDYIIGNDVVSHIDALGAIWPSDIVPGTHAVGGKKLAHTVIDTDSDDPLTLVSVLIKIYGLD